MADLTYTYKGKGRYSAKDVATLYHSDSGRSVNYREEGALLAIGAIELYTVTEKEPLPLALRVVEARGKRLDLFRLLDDKRHERIMEARQVVPYVEPDFSDLDTEYAQIKIDHADPTE